MKNKVIFLTRIPKKVFNRDTYSFSSFMGFNKIGTGLLAASAAAMSPNANAQEADASAAQTAELSEASATTATEAGRLTLEMCAVRPTDESIMQCLAKLEEQNQVEIAALDAQEQELGRENAALSEEEAQIDAENAALQDEEAQVNATTVVLTEKRDGLVLLRDIAREEAEKSGPSR